MLRAAFDAAGWTIEHSEAGLYLWATHPAHDCWSAAEGWPPSGHPGRPGRALRGRGTLHIRVALTATDERITAAAKRLATLRS